MQSSPSSAHDSSIHSSSIHSHIHISGNVVVHSDAAIAPGVLLQADPGCRLTIAAGVCISQAVVVHAYQGHLTIEAGATLGRGVLIIGRGQIGADACIGAGTTILDSSVAAGEILPPNSLVGETGRQVALEPAQPPDPPAESVPDPWATEPAPNFKASFVSGFSAPGSFYQSSGNASNGNGATAKSAQAPAPNPNSAMSAPKTPTQVYGQAYVERIMIAMFPHRRLTQPPNADPPNPP